MAYLSLSDDELALLRFTCDLSFVAESPLFHIEREQREPKDYEAAYQGLVERGIVDPHGFRITDDALNRLAPITECDARVVQVTKAHDGAIEQLDYYLLDDIAVQYLGDGEMHAIGGDLDPDELVVHLARRLVPRKSAGDRVDVQLSPLEYVAFASLARAAAEAPVDFQSVHTLLGRPPKPEALAGSGGPQLLAVLNMRAGAARARTTTADYAPRLHGDEAWNSALSSLVDKGVFRKVTDGLALRPGLVELVRGLDTRERHTFVRYDFADDEWLVRETTFVPVEGGLFFVGTHPESGMRITELDGEGLKAGLLAAVGPLPRDQSAPEPRRLRDLLLGGPPLDDAPL